MLSWDRFKSGVSIYLQLLALPFTSLFGLLRGFLIRVISLRFSNR